MNKDHVAIKPDLDMNWTFLVPSTASTCSEEAREMTETSSLFFQTFGKFVVPVEATLYLQTFPAGSSVPTSERGDPEKRINSQEITEFDSEGIEFTDLFSECDSTNLAYYIPEIQINRVKVNMRLQSGDVFVDRNNHSVTYNVNTPQDRAPTYDPLYFELTHLANLDDIVDTDFVLVLRVRTKTDIWFEETGIGESNRKRLRAFLKRIESTLPVQDVRRQTDWGSVDRMKEVY